MADRHSPPGRSRDNAGLALLAVASAALAALLVLPYLPYVLLAIVLAYVLVPTQRRLERRMRPATAALSLVTLSIVAILIPVAYLLTIAIQEGLELLATVRTGELRPDRIQERFEAVGYVVDLDLLLETYQEPIATGLQGLAAGAIVVLGGLPGVLVGFTVTLFILFALLRDRERLLGWILSVAPVEDPVQRDLLEELDRLMWASVVGNVAVAALQALLLGVGLVLAGVPGVVFLIVATFVLGLLPLVGAFGVWVPVSIYLAAIGRPLAAGLFVVYGSLVSVSDVYLRPALIGRSGTINVAIIVVGIFGGVVVLGAIGLFVGPVILGGAKVVLDLYARETADGATI